MRWHASYSVSRAAVKAVLCPLTIANFLVTVSLPQDETAGYPMPTVRIPFIPLFKLAVRMVLLM